MRLDKARVTLVIFLGYFGFGMVVPVYSAPLRSFAIMPVEKNGYVMRLTLEQTQNVKTEMLMTSIAYGISTNQALLLGIPSMLSPLTNLFGDISVLYRHIIWQKDSQIDANSLGILGGAIVPTDANKDAAAQAGLVFTHIKNKNEIDMDILYQYGFNNRPDSGRYDISWQYRLSPSERPDWGVTPELNSVLEYNGRWNEEKNTTHQITAGLQWIKQIWVLEGGITKDINNKKALRYNVSTRFHF